MKKIKILVLLFFLIQMNCTEVSKKSEVKNNTQTKVEQKIEGEFVGVRFSSRIETEKKFKKVFNKELYLVSRKILPLNNDDIPDTVFVEAIKGWSDPGDFHNVRINVSGQKELSVFNSSGWMKLDEFYFKQLGKMESDHIEYFEYFMKAELSKGENALFFFGYTYASSPGYLSAISIKNTFDPKLVYNENCRLIDVKDLNRNNSKEVIVSSDLEGNILKVFESNLWFTENASLVSKYEQSTSK